MVRRPMKKVFYKNGKRYIRVLRFPTPPRQQSFGSTSSNTQDMDSGAGSSHDRVMDNFPSKESPEKQPEKSNSSMQDLSEDQQTNSCNTINSSVMNMPSSLESVTKTSGADHE